MESVCLLYRFCFLFLFLIRVLLMSCVQLLICNRYRFNLFFIGFLGLHIF